MNALNKNTAAQMKRSPVDFLRDLFSTRRERNSSYSMSAFARDLGVSSSLLSRVLSGSRPMTLKLAMQISTALDLDEAKSNAMVLSVIQSSSKSAKISKKVRAKLENELSKSASQDSGPLYTSVEIERFKTMASWHHLAILNLTTIEGFKNDPVWIAKKLGILAVEAQEAVERLIAVGLLSENETTLQRTKQNFYIKTQRSEFAIRKFHEQMIAKANDQLKNTSDVDFQRRLINGTTFACGPEHLETIKEKIDRLQDEILALVSTGAREDVYQMNVQFFPLTKSKSGESA